jgi:hypothetical protein
MSFTCTLPHNTLPGMRLQVHIPQHLPGGGGPIAFDVPQGIGPGDTVVLTVPAVGGVGGLQPKRSVRFAPAGAQAIIPRTFSSEELHSHDIHRLLKLGLQVRTTAKALWMSARQGRAGAGGPGAGLAAPSFTCALQPSGIGRSFVSLWLWQAVQLHELISADANVVLRRSPILDFGQADYDAR